MCTDIDGQEINFKVDAATYGRNFTIMTANPVLHAEVKGLIAKHLP
jgi:hypothetical protein